MLHLGYLWMPVGLILLGLAGLDAGVDRSTALHALTAGSWEPWSWPSPPAPPWAIRPAPERRRATVAVYLLVTAAAIVRVAGPFVIPAEVAHGASGVLWVAAFALFLLRYGPILAVAGGQRPRRLPTLP